MDSNSYVFTTLHEENAHFDPVYVCANVMQCKCNCITITIIETTFHCVVDFGIRVYLP